MRKLISTLLVTMAFVLNVTAQERIISGKVLDDRGNPAEGISVVVQGTNKGASTTANGSFSISVNRSNTLVFSGVNYETVSLRSPSDNPTVVLKVKTNPLDEIIVTGYQTRKKRDEAGAISSVRAAQLENLPSVSLDKALQGKAAGVLVQSNNGIPGGSINVRIRGEGSINAGNAPLYIVDGVQLNVRNDAIFTQANPLAFLNPDDIESVDILKDAATAAIYGSTASNGVVIVTTKKGRAGKTRFNVSSTIGVVNPLTRLDVLNSQEFYQLRVEAVAAQLNVPVTSLTAKQSALTLLRVTGASAFNDAQADSAGRSLQTYDWQEAAFRQGKIRTVALSASGGNEKTTFRISGSTELQEAFVTKADFKRHGLKLDVNNKATEKLSFNSSINLSTFFQNNPFATDGSFLGSPAFASPGIIPTSPIRNPDGSYYGIPGNTPFSSLIGTLNQNIIAVNEFRSGFTRTNQMVGNVSADYKIFDWLSVKAFGAMDYRLVQGKNVTDARTPDGFNRKGLVQVQSNWNTNISAYTTLNANKQFGTKHRVDGLVGYEYRQENNEGITASGDGFPTFQFVSLQNAANPVAVNEFKTGFKRTGVFANVNYNFDSRYIIGLTGRYDGSSRFGSNNIFGAFYGAKAGWNIDREAFLQNSNVISQLRLRFGIGTTGNDQIGNFDARGLFGGGGVYNGSAGISYTNLENPDLQWERITTSNLGLDFGLFNNRITGAVEVYNKKTDKLLLDQPLQSTSGFQRFTSNIGKLDNRGVELTLSSDIIKSRQAGAFNWNLNFVFAYNKQEVKELYGGNMVLPSDQSIRVGYPVGVLFTQKYAGVNPATGRPMWIDSLGNNTYQTALRDRVIIGQTRLPDYQGGLTNRFSFKGFSLDVFFNYEYGRLATDGQANFLSENLARINTLQYFYDNRWTTPGQITDVPRPNALGAETKGSGAQSGDRTWFKADFIRLKTLTLTYDFPLSSLQTKLGITNARFYIQGTNLYTYSDSYGYDVEFVGTATGIIPQSKIVTTGIQIGF
ncbi:MAG: SusC/RagA family TonB-linked outer membrane protein [Ferruginibacter sp.]